MTFGDDKRPFLPYGRQAIGEDDIASVAEVLRSDFLTTGPVVQKFEAAFVSEVGAKYALSCANGTAALHLAMMSLDLGKEDICVVPAITFAATANSALMTGAEVVFSDVDPETGLMRPEDLEAAIERAGGKRIRLAAPVHLAGQSADMPALSAIARKQGFDLVEDSCHALGSRIASGDGSDQTVGDCAFSKAAIFSFHPVKAIACGEGGMVTTGDPEIARRLALLRSHGIEKNPDSFLPRAFALDSDGRPNPWYHEMVELGWNYRLSDINCALGLSQLGKLAGFCERRRALVEHYDYLLEPFAPKLRRTRRVAGCQPGWHLYVVLIEFAALGTSRAAVMRSLKERGIGTQVHYIPVYRHPYYERRYGEQSLSGAEAYYAKALSLPLFVGMTLSDVERVVESLVDVLGLKGAM